MTNSQRGFAPVLIVLLIIAGAAVAGGGYYVVEKRSEANKEKASKVATTSKSPDPSASVSLAPLPSVTPKASVSAKPRPSVSTTSKPISSPAQQSSNAAGVKTYEPISGWPIKLSSTIPIKGTIESLPHMVVLRIYPVTQ